MDPIDFFSQIFLFKTLTKSEIKKILSFTENILCSRKKLIFSENESADAFYVIKSGKIKIFKLSPDGTEQTLHIQKSGDLVAEAAIFDMKTYPANCEALQKSELFRIPKNKFVEMIMEKPEISLKLMNAYSRRLRNFVSMINDLTLRDIKGRVANYLLSNSTNENNVLACRLSISKKDLAATIGTVPETLSRTFNFFKRQRIISEESGRILILASDKLRSYLE